MGLGKLWIQVQRLLSCIYYPGPGFTGRSTAKNGPKVVVRTREPDIGGRKRRIFVNRFFKKGDALLNAVSGVAIGIVAPQEGMRRLLKSTDFTTDSTTWVLSAADASA
jgi:hypothetical protein